MLLYNGSIYAVNSIYKDILFCHTSKYPRNAKKFYWIFILVINQIDAQNLFYNKLISYLYMFRAPCAHRQEVKIVLYSLWYHHTL